MGAVVRMRELRSSDGRLLVRATLGNVNWSGERFTLADLEATPELSHYFTAWPPDREFGVIAENAHDLAPVGVAWARVFPADDPGYGFVDEVTPEVSVWVSPHHAAAGAKMARRLLWMEFDLAGTSERQIFRESVCALIR